MVCILSTPRNKYCNFSCDLFLNLSLRYKTGKDAFDIPFIMTNLPSCRYSLFHVLTKIGVKYRAIRLNELSMVSSVYKAMIFHFGHPDETGWNPKYCNMMHEALHNHLLTGLSRDYNTPLGLGHLYGLVSKQKLSSQMVYTMTKNSTITDYHPVVLDFIYRWNRLCAMYEGEELPSHPAATSKSHMLWGLPACTEPRLEWLPFEFFTADVMRNPVMEPIPRLFKLQVVNLLTNDERQIQGRRIPQINFYETVIRLKLFIQEADSLHVLGLVDDFCIRKNHDYFFGEDALWLKKVHKKGGPPKAANEVLLNQMKFYHKHYIQHGDTAMSRWLESTALRIYEHRAVPLGMQNAFRRQSAQALIHSIADRMREPEAPEEEDGGFNATDLSPAHERMLRDLAEDEGEDKVLAGRLSLELAQRLGFDDADDTISTGDEETLADAYIRERRQSILLDVDISLLDADDDESECISETTDDVQSDGRRSRRGSKQAAFLRGKGTRALLWTLTDMVDEEEATSTSDDDENDEKVRL